MAKIERIALEIKYASTQPSHIEAIQTLVSLIKVLMNQILLGIKV